MAGTENGAEHIIWRIDSPQAQARIAADLARNEALIADGHHRYAAYLERFRQYPDRPGRIEAWRCWSTTIATR
jgi:uncharacterized protein (DUF1015 family)